MARWTPSPGAGRCRRRASGSWLRWRRWRRRRPRGRAAARQSFPRSSCGRCWPGSRSLSRGGVRRRPPGSGRRRGRAAWSSALASPHTSPPSLQVWMGRS